MFDKLTRLLTSPANWSGLALAIVVAAMCLSIGQIVAAAIHG